MTISEKRLADNIGLLIKKARKAKGFTQKTVGELADVQRGYICRLEKGRHLPSLTMLIRLAGVLDVTASLLLPGEKAGEYEEKEGGNNGKID